MDREPSWNEWLNQPRSTLPRRLTLPLATAVLALTAFGSGLWLTHSEPSVTLVPGTPVAVSIDGGQTTRDPAFIARLVRDLNGNPPYPPNSVTSCFANGLRQDQLRFQFGNGDQLTIQINSGCGNPITIAGYSPPIMARGTSRLLDDLSNWPSPTQ